MKFNINENVTHAFPLKLRQEKAAPPVPNGFLAS